MKKLSIEAKVDRQIGRKGHSVDWQLLKFGYSRAVITCDSHAEFENVLDLAKKIQGSAVSSWLCGIGCFEGRVYIMDAEDKTAYDREVKAEQEYLEEWWMRYHNASEEERKMMACGKMQ